MHSDNVYTSIQMPQFEMFYSRKGQSPSRWREVRQRKLSETDVVMETIEKIEVLREILSSSVMKIKGY